MSVAVIHKRANHSTYHVGGFRATDNWYQDSSGVEVRVRKSSVIHMSTKYRGKVANYRIRLRCF